MDTLTITALFLPAFFSSVTLVKAEEYCWNTFNASCLGDEVIMITTAKYGRMKLGDCLMRDYYVGCSADVTSFMDARCSGKHHCELDIPDNTLQKMQPCPKDLIAYLEASFTCIKVEPRRDKYCRKGETLHIGAGMQSVGYLSSPSVESRDVTSDHFTSSCPWYINVSPGQRINVTLLDFNLLNSAKSENRDVCQVYAVIREKKVSADVTVCGGGQRQKSVYISSYNSVEITVMNIFDNNVPVHFLLRYEAVGCADIAAPPNGWVKRNGNKVMVSCNETGEVRHLVCNGTAWVGDVSDCTGGRTASVAEFLGGSTGFPLGLLVAIIIGILLGIILGIVMLTLVMHVWRRKHRPHGTGRGKIFLTSSSNSQSNNNRGSSCGDKRQPEVVRTSEYGYAHVWELQHLKTNNPDVTLESKDKVTNIDQCLTPHDCGTYGRSTLLKCKDHLYERTIAHGDEMHCSIEEPPFYHEFDAETTEIR